MKTFKLEKAPYHNDGTLGQWELSCYGGKPEQWFDYDQALAAAERRSLTNEDDCEWRVYGDE